MLKVDLHIHTLKNRFLDYDFDYDSSNMIEYVEKNEFDVIAITNHNLFDKNQFIKIKEDLKNINVIVLPGIEISLFNGHILVIGPDTENTYNILIKITKEIQNDENDDHYNMKIDKFNNLCCNNNFILIPHYYKKPFINDEDLTLIEDKIYIGEVDSPKHFYNLKKQNSLNPVMFSDIRIDSLKNSEFYRDRSKFIYLDCNENPSYTEIYRSLKKPNSTFLNTSNENDTFDILNGNAKACTGINVLIGNRSSGKTYTLDHIATNDYESVLYIKQFDITKECQKDTFEKVQKNISEKVVFDYMKDLKFIFDLIDKNVNVDDELSSYLNSLQNFAINGLSDEYSRCKLFNYCEIETKSYDKIKELILSVDNLLDTENQYHYLISKYINIDDLKELYSNLIKINKKNFLSNKLIVKANSINLEISNELGQVSAVEQLTDINMKTIFKNLYIKNKFNKLILRFNKKTILTETIFNKFTKVVNIYKQTNKTKLKSNLGVDKIDNINYLIEMNPYDAYLKSKNDPHIKNGKGDMRFKLFFDTEVIFFNNQNHPLSGGQRAEYTLLNKLFDYKKYDLVLIDEMEASFDNLFLNKEIVSIIRKIANKATVFISTHNNNLGVSLNPDYYIYHSIGDGDEEYLHYCGRSTDDYLVNELGDKKSLNKILVNTMEAGEDAYKERGEKYENINDKR